MLLSFAQFEREVTDERIREKIAASKQKGMWMGRNVPVGYDASGRTLVINPAEAETVRRIFALHRQLGCVRRVKQEADRRGLKSKRRTAASGCTRGGKPLSRGHIYQLLANPIYTGQIAHKGQLYPGQHPALIDAETWSAVRGQLGANARRHGSKADAVEPSLLAGMLFDAQGERLTPSHAVKNGRRYRYYVSAALITEAGTDRTQGWRLAAREIEGAVIRVLAEALTNPAALLECFGTAGMPNDHVRKMLDRSIRMAAALSRSSVKRATLVRELIEGVVIHEKTIVIKVPCAAMLVGHLRASVSQDRNDSAIELTAAVTFKRRGVETKLVLPGLDRRDHASRCDPALIKAIARGRPWFDELSTGRVRSPQDLAKREGITRRYIRRLAGVAFLSPDLVEAILQGRQPVELTAVRLTALDLPLDWIEHRRLLAT